MIKFIFGDFVVLFYNSFSLKNKWKFKFTPGYRCLYSTHLVVVVLVDAFLLRAPASVIRNILTRN